MLTIDRTETFETWVNHADVWQLEAEIKSLTGRISDLWADPDLCLSRNRYEAHDALVMKIRKINGRLETLTA